MRRILLLLAAVVGVVIFLQRVAIRDFYSLLTKQEIPVAVSFQEISGEQGTTVINDSVPSSTAQLPNEEQTSQIGVVSSNNNTSAELNLDVPFQPQAPFADWSMPFKEACEEAAIIMVDYYLRGETLSKEQMRSEIENQIEWQEDTFGGHYDLPMAQVKEMAERIYPYTVELIENITIEKVKAQLRLGHPVIVPSAGRELGNPNFRTPGPLYHMLVIKGYTKNGLIITNDPGTRRGADYVYKPEVLMAAIRDWDGDSPDGPKVGLVMYK